MNENDVWVACFHNEKINDSLLDIGVKSGEQIRLWLIGNFIQQALDPKDWIAMLW